MRFNRFTVKRITQQKLYIPFFVQREDIEKKKQKKFSTEPPKIDGKTTDVLRTQTDMEPLHSY